MDGAGNDTLDAGIGDPFSVTYHDACGEDAADLRILKVGDDSMEPEIREGDRVVVDLSHRLPAAGGTFVLRVGDELVVRRVEAADGDGADGDGRPRLRLISTNPDYAPAHAAHGTSASSARCCGWCGGV